jgi:uncharacterized membrane protein
MSAQPNPPYQPTYQSRPQTAANAPGRARTASPASTAAAILFDLLNPIGFGFFVGALIFDAVYASNADVMWFKSAAWLISIGLVASIVPRLINLARVWVPGARASSGRDKAAFVLHLLGIVAAIVNAFVHSRDAYGVMPDGLWLSIATVVLFVAGNVLLTLQHSSIDNGRRLA